MSDTSLTTTAEAADAATPIIPPHIRRLLGEPPLLRGESKEEFNALLEQLAVDANPKDFASWLLLAETAAKLWEYARYQRMARAVVDDKVTAVAKDFFGDLKRFGDGVFSPEQIKRGAADVAVGMQCGNPEDTVALTGVLRSWGLSVDILYAKATLECQEPFLQFRKLAEGVRKDLRLIERDRERHLFALTQRPKTPAADAEDIAFKEAA